jgi:hypothetical protein
MSFQKQKLRRKINVRDAKVEDWCLPTGMIASEW